MAGCTVDIGHVCVLLLVTLHTRLCMIYATCNCLLSVLCVCPGTLVGLGGTPRETRVARALPLATGVTSVLLLSGEPCCIAACHTAH